MIRPLVLALPLIVVPLIAQAPPMSHDNDMAPAGLPKNFDEPMMLFPKALGKFTRPISSKNPEAQAYFDQGFQLMYAFGKHDAARSFREAEKRDPDCAICYWGEAWAWGSYLNGPMQPFEAPYAWTAAQTALKLAPGHSTPIEAALIEAMSARYVEHFDPAKRHDQDAAYITSVKSARLPGVLSQGRYAVSAPHPSQESPHNPCSRSPKRRRDWGPYARKPCPEASTEGTGVYSQTAESKTLIPAK